MEVPLKRDRSPREPVRHSNSFQSWLHRGMHGSAFIAGPMKNECSNRIGVNEEQHLCAGQTIVQELESAVTSLPAEELHQFVQWFEEYLASQRDVRISSGTAAGKLKAFMDEADEDYAAGNCTPL